MKYLIIAIIVFSLVLIPSSVYAWPEPVSLTSGNCTSNWGGWPCHAKSYYKISSDTPPQLNFAQTFRWRIASQSAKAILAERWGVPKDIAEQHGARYFIRIYRYGCW